MPAIAVDNAASTPLVEPVAPLRSSGARSDGSNSFDDHLQRVSSPPSGSASPQSSSQNATSPPDRKDQAKPASAKTANKESSATNDSRQEPSATASDETAPPPDGSEAAELATSNPDSEAHEGKHRDRKHNPNVESSGNTPAGTTAAAVELTAKQAIQPVIEKGEKNILKEESAEAAAKLGDEKSSKSKPATSVNRSGGKATSANPAATKPTTIPVASNTQATAENANPPTGDADAQSVQQAAAEAALAAEQAAAKLDGTAIVRPVVGEKPKQANTSKDKNTQAVGRNPLARHVAEKTDDPTEPTAEHGSASDATEPKTKQSNRPRSAAFLASDAKPTVEAAAAKAADSQPTTPAQLPPAVAAAASQEIASAAKPTEPTANSDRTAPPASVSGAPAAPATNNTTQGTPPTTNNPVPSTGLPTATKRTAATSSNTTNLNEVDRARFVQRVARAMQTAGDRGGEIRLRLSPPELGALKLEVSVRDGVMNARVEAETTTARSLLVDNLPALRERLAEQNIKIDRFDVDVQSGSSGSLPDRSAGDADANARRGAANGRNSGISADAATDATKTPAATHRVFRDGHLNVIV